MVDSFLFKQGICVFFQWNYDDDYNNVRFVLRDQVTAHFKCEDKGPVVTSIDQLIKVSSFLLIQLNCFKKRLEVSSSKPLNKKRQVSYCNSCKFRIPWVGMYFGFKKAVSLNRENCCQNNDCNGDYSIMDNYLISH